MLGAIVRPRLELAMKTSILGICVVIMTIHGADTARAATESAVHNDLQLSGMAQQEREVWRVVEAWNAAFAANDVEKYFSYIDSDIVVMTPSNPYRVEGLPDDREEFVFGLHKGYSRVSLFQEIAPVVNVYGDVAVVTYFNRGYYGPEEDGAMAYLKETNVLRRMTDGAWRIVHIHVSK